MKVFLRYRLSDTEGRGFTLLELLAATAIFAMLGGMIFSIMRGSLEVWGRGEAGRDLSERAVTILDRMAFEIRHAYANNPPGEAVPPVQFRCEYHGFDSDRDGILDRRIQRLRFVRTTFEERSNEMVALAGANALADKYWTPAAGDEPEAAVNYLPNGGLAEVCFVPLIPSEKDYDGSMMLTRASRMPPGGEGSLFDDEVNIFSSPLEWIRTGRYQILAEGILHLGFRFRTQSAESFTSITQMGVLSAWDSTRGILPHDESALNSSPFSQVDEGFDALAQNSDDVFPYQVEITLIVGRTGEDRRMETLRAPVPQEDKRPTLDLRSTKFLEDSRDTPLVIKVGNEWMEVAEFSGTTVRIKKRGVHGSLVAPHNPGEPVRYGRTFRRVVTLPCFREALDG